MTGRAAPAPKLDEETPGSSDKVSPSEPASLSRSSSPASTLAGDAWSDYRQFTILPSCPADLDGNGIVDPGDLADFMKCFFSMPPCPAADFNADGTTDPDDLADFITAFFTGC